MRGEYLKEGVRVDHRKELPPHARRIPGLEDQPL